MVKVTIITQGSGISILSARGVKGALFAKGISSVSNKKTYELDFSEDDLPIGITFNRTSATSQSQYVLVSYDNRTIFQQSFAYSQVRILARITKELLGLTSGSETAVTAAGNHYVLKSPMERGSYTESVRALTPEQVARFRSRGWIVEGTTRGLSPAITVNANREISTVDAFRRTPRRGFTGQFMPTPVKQILKHVVHRSQLISPRRMFNEPFEEELVRYYSDARKKYMTVRPSTAAALNRRGYRLRKVGTTGRTFQTTTSRPTTTRPPVVSTPTRTPSTSRTSSGTYTYYSTRYNRYVRLSAASAKSLNSRGWQLTKMSAQRSPIDPRTGKLIQSGKGLPPPSQIEEWMRNKYGGKGTPTTPTPNTNPYVPTPKPAYVPPNQDDLDARIKQLIQQAQRDLSWIEGMDKRLSAQVTELGNIGVDQQAQIGGNAQHIENTRQWLKEVDERLSAQVVAAHNAASELSKQIAALNLEKTLEDLKKNAEDTGGSIFGGIGEFFKDNQLLLVAGIALIGLVILKK